MTPQSAADVQGAHGESLAVRLTGAGRGAIAVVAAKGPHAEAVVDAQFRAANGRALRDQPANRVLFGVWRHARAESSDAGEEVVVSRAAGGVLEIHCHGGEAASASILAALAAGGCRVVTHREWLQSQLPSPIAVDAELALALAPTLRTAAILADQRGGALGRVVGDILARLAAGDAPAARQMIADLLKWRGLGSRLTEPWRVAVAGPPNVGKSSLVNAMVGYQRAIVFDTPGTTRDILAADTAIDGWPVRLTDSAGIRETDCELEGAGVALARQQLATADLVLWVIDAREAPSLEPAAIRRRVVGELQSEQLASHSVLAVVNKIDLLALAPAHSLESGDVVFVSATTRAGLDDLLTTISRRLVPESPPRCTAVPFTRGQIAALEQALAHLDRDDVAGAHASFLQPATANLARTLR